MSAAFALCVADFDLDGHEDLFMGQNNFGVQEGQARQDSGRGLVLLGEGGGNLKALSPGESGIEIFGEQRGAAVGDFDRDGRVDLVVAQHNAETKLFRNTSKNQGLRVRLSGSPGNRSGVGSTLQLEFNSQKGPLRTISAGSGYWSQESATQILATPEPPTAILVHWDDGRSTRSLVPQGAKEIRVDLQGAVTVQSP